MCSYLLYEFCLTCTTKSDRKYRKKERASEQALMQIAFISCGGLSVRFWQPHIFTRCVTSWSRLGVARPSVRAGLSNRFQLMKFSKLPRSNDLSFINFSLKEKGRGAGAEKVKLFWRGRADDNVSLVELLQEDGTIKSERVARIMKELDRGLFAPASEIAYIDTPLPIGYNATISAPHMHAACLELLENHLQPRMRALDVGSGTGYLTAAFAQMVGDQGYAVGVEHIPELVEQAIKNVKRSKAAPLLESGRLSFHVADGRKGWPGQALYDAIHVGAAASNVPQTLVDQLKTGGRMVIPVGNEFQNLLVIDKKLDGSLDVRSTAPVRYVPLTSRDAQLNY